MKLNSSHPDLINSVQGAEFLYSVRGFAIALVVLFHLQVSGAEFGYLGVTLFFALSGYLLSARYCSEHSGDFNIVAYSRRRFFRIVPALAFIVGVSIALSNFLLFHVDRVELLKEAAASMSFTSNWFYLSRTDYFAISNDTYIFLHLWSLAVEVQAYILFGLLFHFFQKDKTRLGNVLLTLTIVSLVSDITFFPNFQWKSYFITPFRLWEFTLVTMVFFFRKRVLFLILSIAFLASTQFMDEEGLAYLLPRLIAITAFVASILAIAAYPSFYRSSRVSCRGLRGVTRILALLGRSAYTIFLIHFPVIALTYVYYGAEASMVHKVTALLLAAPIFAITHFIFEWSRGDGSTLFDSWFSYYRLSAAVVVSGVVLGVAFLTSTLLAEERIISPFSSFDAAAAVREFSSDVSPQRDACLVRGSMTMPSQICHFISDTEIGGVMLLGDSHAEVLAPGLREFYAVRGTQFLQYTKSGCVGLPGFWMVSVRGLDQTCDAFVRDALEVAKERRIETLILSSRWPLYFSGTLPKNHLGFKERGWPPRLLYSKRQLEVSADSSRDALYGDLAHEVEELMQNFNVIVVAGTPEFSLNVPKELAYCMLRTGDARSCSISLPTATNVARNKRIHETFGALASPNLVYLDLTSFFCGTVCSAVRDGKPLYHDDDHLAYSSGARRAVEYIVANIN